jgi:hypothetical protein
VEVVRKGKKLSEKEGRKKYGGVTAIIIKQKTTADRNVPVFNSSIVKLS